MWLLNYNKAHDQFQVHQRALAWLFPTHSLEESYDDDYILKPCTLKDRLKLLVILCFSLVNLRPVLSPLAIFQPVPVNCLGLSETEQYYQLCQVWLCHEHILNNFVCQRGCGNYRRGIFFVMRLYNVIQWGFIGCHKLAFTNMFKCVLCDRQTVSYIFVAI